MGCRGLRLLNPLLELSFQLSVQFLFSCSLALIIVLFTTGEAYLDLYQSIFDVYLQGHQGIALFLYLCPQLIDLVSVKQKLSGAQRLFIKDVALLVWADMHAIHPDFTLIDSYECFFDGDFALADGLDFRAEELDARFILFFDEVVEVRFFVVCFQDEVFFFVHFVISS